MKFKIEIINNEIPPELTAFARACIKDSLLKHIDVKVDPEELVNALQYFAQSPKHVFLIAKDEEKVIGAMLGSIRLYPFTKLKFAVNYYMNVLEEYRGKDVGKILLQNFELWAKQRDCKLVVFGVNNLASHDTKRSNQFISSQDGYKHYGTDYFKELS